MTYSLTTFADNLRNALVDTLKTGNLSSLSSIMQSMYDALEVPYRGRASLGVPGCSLEVSLPEPSSVGLDADFFSRHLQVVLDLPANFEVGDSDYLEADAGDDEITLEVLDDPDQCGYSAVITLIRHFEVPWDGGCVCEGG